MNRLSLTQRILLAILAVQAALFAALAVASLDSVRRDIAAETRLAVDTALSLIHISEPTRRTERSRMPSSA